MGISKMFANVISFMSDALSRVFGLNDDDYPATGVQPYSGDSNDDSHASNW
ncbi:hypothetical protein [Alkalinema sp. FACHB-956]|uniref:hypothetical protein n=1 Tax=Alkalinema sp. FACHB-956 TaxID=2692768 RepID=UPI0016884849|nr:hypothetical protein [Alkalinema sp. FACHB-956]MBD2327544.1 hypothetical protein [Alkalinema sp. FACHB-956]